MILFISGMCLILGYLIGHFRYQAEKRMEHRAILYRENHAYYIQLVNGPMTGLVAHLYPSDMRFGKTPSP